MRGASPANVSKMSTETEQQTYSVPTMSCEHCRSAISAAVGDVPGVTAVAVDLDTKRVTVTGPALDDAAIRAAIEEAGYEAS